MRMRGWVVLSCVLLSGTWGATLGFRWASTGAGILEAGEDEEQGDGAETDGETEAAVTAGGEAEAAAVGADPVKGRSGGDESVLRVRRICMERDGVSTYMVLEDYLPGVVACQIDLHSAAEVQKCQAIIARTYICRLMGEREEIHEEELDLDYLGKRTLEAAGTAEREQMARLLEECEEAVRETEGLVMTYEGEYILPLFHAVSAGKTRQGEADYPYLKSVESRWDREAEDFERSYAWSRQEFALRISGIRDGQSVEASQIPGQMQTIRKDEAGYMVRMKIGAGEYSGEEIQYALELPSACFTFSGTGDEICALVRGQGHGYGLSQAGADGMAREGWGCEEILKYFYSGIAVEKESDSE
ncbi:MAG: SpoIID/LytB domain-containing protein [Clostridiales bacterium]|nr:SpoIID/LytB domain-containing protein [Clostridiales bacterium]